MSNGSMPMKPTGTNTSLPIRFEGFGNLVEALEYAAQGESGYNFYNGRGELHAVLSYADLRDEAKVLARRLLGLGCPRGSRVAIIGETATLFHRFLFAFQSAGYCPVTLPSIVHVGARNASGTQIST